MESLIGENKLQFDEKNNKNWKVWKNINMIITNFKTIRYKMTASGKLN